MKSKIVPMLFLLQGFGIVFTSISNIITGMNFKYNTIELPYRFNYISIGIGLLFLLCFFGMLSRHKFFYKLGFFLSIIMVLYLSANIILILTTKIVLGALIILFLYLIVYAYVIKNLIYEIKFAG